MAKKKGLIQVGELAVGFSENILPDTSDLNGKSLTLYFEDGSITSYQFHDNSSLTWKTLEGSDKSRKNDEQYRATCPRKNIYFVDYIQKNSRATSVSLVLDLEKGIATSLTGTLPTEEEARMDRLDRVAAGMFETAVEAVFKSASIGKKLTGKTPRHEITKDLIGKRIKYSFFIQTSKFFRNHN